MWSEDECLEKPGDMGSMPFRRADVRHRLHGLVLRAEGGGQALGGGANHVVRRSLIRWRGWTAVLGHQILPSGRSALRSRGVVLSFAAITLPRSPEDTRAPPRATEAVGGRRGRIPVLARSIEGITVIATYEGTEIARSDRTVVVEGNHYFPAEDVQEGFLEPSDTHTNCPWKGEASYYDVVLGERRNPDAAWYYPNPKDAAKEITDRVAFWKGVAVTEA